MLTNKKKLNERHMRTLVQIIAKLKIMMELAQNVRINYVPTENNYYCVKPTENC